MPINTSQARTVFISYAREDEDLILPVAHLLRAAGAVVFLDLEDIPYGEKWESILLEKLHAAERILVFWSVNAANSEWVRREYLIAIGLGLRVIPIPLDATPLPAELATFQALAALVPLVYELRRSRASRGVRWSILSPRYGMALTAALLVFAMTSMFAILPSSVSVETAETAASRLPGSAAWLTGAVALIIPIGLLLRWTDQPSQRELQHIQAAIYDAVFGENKRVDSA